VVFSSERSWVKWITVLNAKGDVYFFLHADSEPTASILM
jgi:hypothetical protein